MVFAQLVRRYLTFKAATGTCLLIGGFYGYSHYIKHADDRLNERVSAAGVATAYLHKHQEYETKSPEALNCHAAAQKQLGSLLEQAASVILVGGNRGSGKTWTVRHVLFRHLQKNPDKLVYALTTAGPMTEARLVDALVDTFNLNSPSKVRDVTVGSAGLGMTLVPADAQPTDRYRQAIKAIDKFLDQQKKENKAVLLVVDDLENFGASETDRDIALALMNQLQSWAIDEKLKVIAISSSPVASDSLTDNLHGTQMHRVDIDALNRDEAVAYTKALMSIQNAPNTVTPAFLVEHVGVLPAHLCAAVARLATISGPQLVVELQRDAKKQLVRTMVHSHRVGDTTFYPVLRAILKKQLNIRHPLVLSTSLELLEKKGLVTFNIETMVYTFVSPVVTAAASDLARQSWWHFF
ncbi:hypothetical protein CAOG_00614 [Capsaspora owczarzaki ATCC 30864]|uniref:Orc1-like AAA ATPase domain-containing protein n=1 Tax=Capsaspora owczarzaki (strain ATCC 30864) TaxID=595528 RepID=A0A0D2WIV2_CAPO3|nr:hypothetical protein CAOG_00614 [Capsaspora owczarzaki ATCC 30864]KJE89063.1 hypothetical protein CAOG_000614 [Capsaspora owczarzaki ATCC 30864]|eukprot:XP_004365485.1 hypothetical protein CAOG_00614 [Capsaspora owczarzaki ATCC 30864]